MAEIKIGPVDRDRMAEIAVKVEAMICDLLSNEEGKISAMEYMYLHFYLLEEAKAVFEKMMHLKAGNTKSE